MRAALAAPIIFHRSDFGLVEAQCVRLGYRTLVPLALCAAAAAAALAHFAIDVIGDVALTRDSYDHLHHGSRELLTGIAVLLAMLLAGHGLRVCCDIATRNRARITVPTGRGRERLTFLLASVGITALFVPAMEYLDAAMAGVQVQVLGDAFGGSLALGLLTTTTCAAIVAMAVYALARWLISHHDSIAGIIETLLGKGDDTARACSFEPWREHVTPWSLRILGVWQLSKRGPPGIVLT